MKGIGLDARIRRKESIKALKNGDRDPLPDFLGYGDKSHLPEAPNVPPDTNQLQEFRDQLLDIDRKKSQQLVVSTPKGSGFLKFSTILVVFLFALSGVFFFAGGYLFSYMNPPSGSSISTNSAIISQDKPDWRIGSVVEGRVSAQDSSIPATYMARRTYLERNEVLADKVYGKTESRVKLAAQKEAKRIGNKTIRKIKSAVRSVVGTSVANIFNPLAVGVVNSTVGGVVDKALPVKTEATGSDTKEPSSSDGSVESDGDTALPREMGTLFALELQTFLDSTDALMFMRTLKEKGYTAAYIVRARAGKNMVYKVRVGNFSNYGDASETRKSIGYPSRVVFSTRSDDKMKY